jgi:hypothetical protein
MVVLDSLQSDLEAARYEMTQGSHVKQPAAPAPTEQAAS